MRPRALIAFLALLAACSSSSPSAQSWARELLESEDRGQVGPRYLITEGDFPGDGGGEWLLAAYRRTVGEFDQICVGQGWFENGESGFQGTCPAHEKPREPIHNTVTTPRRTDAFRYMLASSSTTGRW